MLVSVYAWIRRCVCVCVWLCLIVFEGRPSRCVVIVQRFRMALIVFLCKFDPST